MSASGINGLLNMGVGALFASQACIQTTGNNISNVNTVGYSRQAVQLEERVSIDSRPGQVGQGVEATQIYRYFNKFVESSYLDRFTMQRRYEEEYDMQTNVDTLFNESNSAGISSALNAMFKSWNDLAQTPNSQSARAALLENMKTLTATVGNADGTLVALQDQMNQAIKDQVNKANTLIKQIADLNREINAHTIEGRNNANAMMDERDAKVRELSGILDVHVDNKGAGHYSVTTGDGMLLVQEGIPYSLEMRGPQSKNSLQASSVYNGTVGFNGSDGYEYTLQVVTPGTVDTTGATTPPAGTATYKLSLDGGKTWVMDDTTGQPKIFYATDQANSARVKNLDIYFTGTTALTKGDTFTLTPKSDVYWISPTSGPIDISTQINQDGTDNGMRITGGTLAGDLEFRDYRIGAYRDQLAAFSNTLTWEMNRIHSQGAGLTKLTSVLGDYAVTRTTVPLGSRSSGSPWFDRLQEGNVSFAIYDSTTGASVIPYPGIQAFSPPTNFNPATDSLTDVVNAINAGPAGSYLTASIVDARLQLTANSGYSFGITADTSGLAAALGINTILTGDSPATMGINGTILNNPNFVNASRVNGAGEGNPGDNIVAREMTELATKRISIGTTDGPHSMQSISDYYSSLVTKVGADTSAVKFTAATQRTMATELSDRCEAISGVNLDEEMSSLIKFQASYKAAAKLITTSDEMLQTLLSLKQ